MGCKLMVMNDNKGGKMVAIVCGVKQSICYKCGRPATKLCDYPISKHASCDKPMCVECANSVGADNDVCDEHYNKIDIEKAQNNRIELKNNGWKIEDI